MTKWLNANFPNWRTTFAGIFTGVMVAMYDLFSSGTVHKSAVFLALGMAITGYFAKDKHVTGGNVPQTPEAASRAEEIDPKVAQLAHNHQINRR